MLTTGEEVKVRAGLTITPLLVVLLCLSSCSSPAEPDPNSEYEPFGQVVSDVVQAVLKPDGTVWTWGFNGSGTLGNGTTESSDIPVKVLHLKNVVAIDFREGMGVAVDNSGDIWFWGTCFSAGVYARIVKEPVRISKLKTVTSIDIIHANIYLLRDDETVWYITVDPAEPSRFIEPAKVTGVHNIIKISDYIALSSDGILYKLSDYDQLYGGLVDGLQDIVDLQNVYNRRTVILKGDGTVWAWGRNVLGELGNGSFEDSAVPVPVSTLTDIVNISANYDFNLALRNDGTVWFWGFEKRNENNEPVGLSVPVRIKSLNNVSLIYAAYPSIVKTKDGRYMIFDGEDKLPREVQFE